MRQGQFAGDGACPASAWRCPEGGDGSRQPAQAYAGWTEPLPEGGGGTVLVLDRERKCVCVCVGVGVCWGRAGRGVWSHISKGRQGRVGRVVSREKQRMQSNGIGPFSCSSTVVSLASAWDMGCVCASSTVDGGGRGCGLA